MLINSPIKDLVNIDEIKQQFKQVIKYSQGFEPNEYAVDEIFNRFLINKERFVKKWGGLTVQLTDAPMTFTLNAEDKERLFKDFLVKLRESAFDDLLFFLTVQGAESFFDNKVTSDYVYKDKVIPEGSKIVKNFKHFLPSYVLDYFQQEASRYIQMNKITGILCLSVHPLDFLSLSENNQNWRSCHALDGDYRAGNISYMMDKSTFIAYLKTDNEKVNINNFPSSIPWYSKKWRMLIYESELGHMLFASKQYPLQIKELMDLSLKLYNEHDMLRYYSRWNNDYINNFKDKYFFPSNTYIPLHNNILDINKIFYSNCDYPADIYYNDVLRSSSYTQPYYSTNSFIDYNTPISFNIGENVPCLKCGKSILDSGHLMYCQQCDDEWDEEDETIGACEKCGEPIYEGDTYFLRDNYIICENCVLESEEE